MPALGIASPIRLKSRDLVQGGRFRGIPNFQGRLDQMPRCCRLLAAADGRAFRALWTPSLHWRRALVVSLGLVLAIALAGHAQEPAAPSDPDELFRTGRYAECVKVATIALEELTGSERLWLVKLQAEMAQGKYADALQTLDASLEKVPTSLQLRWIGRDVCR